MRVAEQVVRTGPFGRKLRLRVDLHGVSVFGPRDHTLIRWEWIEDLEVGDGVTVRSATSEVNFPRRAFGLSPDALARLLREAASIEQRPEVIARLGAGGRSLG